MQDYLEKHPITSQLLSDVVIESRDVVPTIAEYVRCSIDNIDHFICIVENVFNPVEIFDMLNKVLPSVNIESQKESFINDVIRLGTLFFSLTKSKRVKIELEVVKSDMCRLFHQDNYRQRLLCTYQGPGTEWLDHSNVNRTGLGKGCNSRVVKCMDEINRAKEFDVLLIKGSKYEGDLSVIHRSPPIEHTKQQRLLLKIDEYDRN